MHTVTLNFPAIGKWVFAYLIAQWLTVPPGNRTALVTLMIFMGFDLATGLWAAWIEGKVCSEVGLRGISKKLGTVGMLLFAHLLEDRLHMELNLEMVGALGYTLNEAISTLENFSRIGVPIPAPLVEALVKVKKLRPAQASAEQLEELHDEPGVKP